MGDAVKHAIFPEGINLFGLSVSPAVVTAFCVSLFLIIFCAAVRIFAIPRFKKIPNGFQMILESIVSAFDKGTKEVVHNHTSFVGPYVFTSAMFIGITTLCELIGLYPAFASINTAIAFGFTTFVIINICGFREKGLTRFKRYKNPLNIISDLTVPLSLSLRLFGSILSGFIIMELLYSSLATSIVLPAPVAVITTIFHAVLQSFLFYTLSNLFIGEAIEE